MSVMRRRSTSILFVSAAVALLASPHAQQAGSSAASAIAPEPLALPAGDNTTEPQLTTGGSPDDPELARACRHPHSAQVRRTYAVRLVRCPRRRRRQRLHGQFRRRAVRAFDDGWQ